MQRRRFSTLLAAAPVAAFHWCLPESARAAQPNIQSLREEWRRYIPDGLEIPDRDDTLDLNASQWRSRLSPDRFRILREEDTEPAFSSPLNDEQRPGIYLCAGCGLPLFTSAMKYDSGTGWPSFFTTIPDVFDTKRDLVLFIPRTEYHCVRCGGHHGHIFDDGPPPTGERWCNNGLALRFEPLVDAA